MLVTVFIDLRLLRRDEDFRQVMTRPICGRSGEEVVGSDEGSRARHLDISPVYLLCRILLHDCRLPKKKNRHCFEKWCKILNACTPRYVSHPVEDCYSRSFGVRSRLALTRSAT